MPVSSVLSYRKVANKMNNGGSTSVFFAHWCGMGCSWVLVPLFFHHHMARAKQKFSAGLTLALTFP
ncbi:MAG: hypothetical protein EAY75_16165 [Bacteroidetes bacterium]|nr:MAG: hypothetical protein EAY75_16165 [Bacteroidota bacterium]